MIEDFINKFKQSYPLELESSFLNGNCYWFAYILLERFPNGLLCYDDISNHFFVRICRKFYDISGEINPTHYVLWSAYEKYEPLNAKRVINNCKLFLE